MTMGQPIEVPFEVVLERFSAENAALSRRAIVAESQVVALQGQLAELQQQAQQSAEPAVSA